MPLSAIGIRCYPRYKRIVFRIVIQVHGAVIDQCRLMKTYIKSALCLKQQWRLDTCLRKWSLRSIRGNGRFHILLYFRHFGNCIIILLRIIVAGNPICHRISLYRKLRFFLLNGKINEVVLSRKFVSKTQTIIKYSEPNNHHAPGCRMIKKYSHFIVVIADFILFTPDWLPDFIKSRFYYILYFKTFIHLTSCLRGLLFCLSGKGVLLSGFILQFKAHFTIRNNDFVFIN